MDDWNAVFDSPESAGVYRAGPDVNEVDVRAAAVLRGFEFARIDLSGVNSKPGFLTEMARALDFPAYFGMNWDALQECLTDMSWKPAAGYVLLLAGFCSMVDRAGADMAPATAILNAAAEYWKQKRVPFYVILSAGRRDAPGESEEPCELLTWIPGDRRVPAGSHGFRHPLFLGVRRC